MNAHLILALTATLSVQEGGADERTLLAAIPGDAVALAYCEDVAAFRGRLELNEWTRFTEEEGGGALREGLDDMFTDLTRAPVAPFLEVCGDLADDALFFATDGGTGLLTVPGNDRKGRVERFLQWLVAREYGGEPRMVTHGGATLWVVHETPPGAGVFDQERIAAVVDHPLAIALYTDEDEANLVQRVGASLRALDAREEGELARAFRGARSRFGRGGLEAFIDFTGLESEANEALEDLAEWGLTDPHDLLGLDGGTWAYAAFDVHPGTRVELRGHLHLPGHTLTEKLARAFQPLPRDLLAGVPKGVFGLWAINWNLGAFYETARKGLEEAERDVESVDMLEAQAGAVTGVDFVEDILKGLSGTMQLYQAPATSVEEDETRLDPFDEIGGELRVHDGDAFEDALGALIDLAESTDLKPTVLEGFDVYLANGEGDGGFAFLPDRFVLAITESLFTKALMGNAGKLEASAADATPLAAAFDESAGAFWFTWHSLEAVRQAAYPDWKPEGPDAVNPFEAQLVTTARHVDGGIELAIRVR